MSQYRIKLLATVGVALMGVVAAGVVGFAANGRSAGTTRNSTPGTGDAPSSQSELTAYGKVSGEKATVAVFAAPPHPGPALSPNLDRLTVSLDSPNHVVTAHNGTKIPLTVWLMGRPGDTMGPVRLTVASGKTNPHTYHEAYPVTEHAIQLGQASVKEHDSVPMPKQSGVYQITATFDVSPMAGMKNVTERHKQVDARLTVYVDNGGFYRSGHLTKAQHLKVGPLTVNVTGVKMTSTYTEITFTANTSSADMQVFQNITVADGTTQTVAMAEQQTSIFSKQVPQWEVYTSPVQTSAKSLTMKFKHDASINNQWPSSTASVTIPLPTAKTRS